MLEEISMALGDNRIHIIYLVCLLSGLFFLREKRKHLFLPAVIMTVMIVNPVMFNFWYKFNEHAYWRLLWIIPIVVVSSITPAFVIDKVNRIWIKVSVLVFSVLLIISGGSLVYKYNNTAFEEARNMEKLPNETIEVAEELLSLSDYPKVVTDEGLSTYLRQYSSRIQSPYSRSVSYGYPSSDGREFFSFLINLDSAALAQKMLNFDYEFLVTRRFENNENGFNNHFILIKMIGDYGLYRVYGSRTEVREYNELGQTVKITNVDSNGNTIIISDGYASVEYEYDRYGRVIYEFRRGLDGNGVLDKYKTAGYRREYDHLGHIKWQTYLGEDGRPKTINYCTKKCEYDNKKRLCKESYYDEQDNLMLRNDLLYASKIIIYDSQDRVASERYFGVNNESVLSSEGYAEINYIYDENGSLIETNKYNEAHQLID